MGIILAIIVFGLIIFVHELGHFLLAKANGIDVTEFALGMGPILLKKEYKGTVYALKLLPIGGSCMMGEDEEVTDSPGNFNNKGVLARISVIVAGAVFNFIFAFILAVVLKGFVGYDDTVIGEVTPSYPAAEAGVEAGDVITKINGKNVHLFRELSTHNQLHQGEDVTLTYVRDGKEESVKLTPKYDDELKYYRLGVTGGAYQKASVSQMFKYGFYEVEYVIKVTFKSLGMMVTGQVGINDLSGPVGIVNLVDDTYQQTKSDGALTVIINLMNLAILISANLGVMNLLPLPALDGGRLVFLIIEGVRRKRIPPEKEGMVHMVGIILLLLLMLVVTFNDVRKLFF